MSCISTYCTQPNCPVCTKISEPGGAGYAGYVGYNTDTTKQILLRIEQKLDRLLSKTEEGSEWKS